MSYLTFRGLDTTLLILVIIIAIILFLAFLRIVRAAVYALKPRSHYVRSRVVRDVV